MQSSHMHRETTKLTADLSRRTFLRSAIAASVMPEIESWGQGHSSAREIARELPYGAVQLTGGPLKEQYDLLHGYYLALDNERLLKVYRQRAGLPAPGADMGGWYDLNGFVPGHTLGQYISGLARIGATTGDAACHEKVHTLVAGFGQTLGEKNTSILRPQTNLWVCYTLDKHFAGLIDAAQWSGIAEAKDLLNRVLAGAEPLLPKLGRDRIGKKDPPYDETFVMPENLFTAHELTGNPRFRELAERYLLDREFFDVLARGGDPLPGQHAYSHAIALSSGGKAFLVSGDRKYYDALDRAFDLLTTEQKFASGGWGPNETFIEPHKGMLYESLFSTVDHFETPCGAYAATKLARYLLRTTARADRRVKYADYLERVLYNTILAVKLPDSDGDYPYYSTYSPIATKVYYQKKWPCCSGTLVQTVADYPLDLYMQTEQGIEVNLFVPSHARWTHGDSQVDLVQETKYPAEDKVTLRITPSRPTVFTVSVRVPSWAAGRIQLRVNGRSATSSSPGTYAVLRREWRAGDVVEFIIHQDFRSEPIDEQHPEVVALMRGAVQYVALNPNSEQEARHLPKLPFTLRPSGTQVFTENVEGREAVLVPLFTLQNQTYTSYFSRA